MKTINQGCFTVENQATYNFGSHHLPCWHCLRFTWYSLDISEEAGSLTGDCGDAGARPQLRPEVRLICGVVIIIIPRNYEKTEEIYWFIYEVP